MNTSQINRSMDMSDSDHIIDKLISENDDTIMPLPDIGAEPHLLMSKVSLDLSAISKNICYLFHIYLVHILGP